MATEIQCAQGYLQIPHNESGRIRFVPGPKPKRDNTLINFLGNPIHLISPTLLMSHRRLLTEWIQSTPVGFMPFDKLGEVSY